MTSRYADAGVRGQSEALSAVVRHLGPTLDYPHGAEVIAGFGHYAAVIRLSEDLALAMATDGVGSKTLIASALGRYDTIGIDCIAMNVNDILCVGARPLALVDYLGVHRLDPAQSAALLEGLAAGAKDASIAIPGGEIAQLPGVIGPGHDAFDLVGTCIGVVHPDHLVLGREVRDGDALIGIASSGIHSNGLTLARKVLLDDGGFRLDEHVSVLGRTLGEELLEPTTIYARAVLGLWDVGIPTTALAHITGDGLANLCRLDSPVGFVVDDLPRTPEIFELIRTSGAVSDEEMYRVFNMGVGFVVATNPQAAHEAVACIQAAGYRCRIIGRAGGTPGQVRLVSEKLLATLDGGDAAFRRL